MLGAFALWESYTPSPMLDTSFFKNPRFTAASMGIMLLFFAMFGSIFLLTQYLQFVMGYSRARGRRPAAADGDHDARGRAEQRAHRRAGRHQASSSASGSTLAGIGLALFATLPADNISYWGDVAWRMVVMAIGMGLTMAPATESIMGSLPAGEGRCRLGDERHDPSGRRRARCRDHRQRHVVAVRTAGRRMRSARRGLTGPPVDIAQEGLGQALEVASNPRVPADVAAELANGAKEAFVYGMHRGVLVGAAAAFLGAVIAFRYLPAREAPVPSQEPASGVGPERSAEPANVEPVDVGVEIR